MNTTKTAFWQTSFDSLSIRIYPQHITYSVGGVWKNTPQWMFDQIAEELRVDASLDVAEFMANHSMINFY